ncbi:MAG: biotin/lipoyl-binding protein [Prevotellaceae bacterium]|jgi:hypothetical protein|nr:biotin/lipoyl-binding protein [Prevotellaceae bacterium]
MYKILINKNNSGEQKIKTDCNGIILSVNIETDNHVTLGQRLLSIQTEGDNLVVIFSPLAGRIKSVNVKSGDSVLEGDLLAIIDGIENYEFQQADTGNDTIALTYAVNDIAELKSRQANRSNAVKLPRTPRNDLVFGLPSEPNSLTTNPYRYMDVRVFDDGVELFGKGAKLKLTETNHKEHVVSFYGSIFDLFAELRSKTLRDFTFLGDIQWTLNSVAASHFYGDNLANIVFPVMEWYIEDNSPFFQEDDWWIMKSDRLYPAVKFSYLCTKILEYFGYTLELPQEILDDERYKNAVIPFARMEVSDERKNFAIQGKAWGDTVSYNDAYQHFYPLKYKTDRFASTPSSDNRARFTAMETGTYTFGITINIISTNNTALVNLYITQPNNDSAYDLDLDIDNHGENIEMYSVELNAGDFIEFGARTLNGYPNQITYNIKISCIGLEMQGATFGSPLDIASNLPEITGEDLFFILARQWCLVPEVDERHKVLRFWKFDRLYENKKAGLAQGVAAGTVKDWSGKLDNREHQVQFRWNTYAQKNIIQYKEESKINQTDKNDEKVTSIGVFNIEDYTLEREKTLFEIPASATEETVNMDNVKMAIIDAGGGRPDTSCRFLICKKTDDLLRLRYGGVNQNLSSFWTARFEPAGMEIFINEYGTVVNGMLNRCRLVIEKFHLTPLDLKDFDHSVPVYLSKYGCCFYVNKINNYIPGRLTEVELIPLRYLDI